jgi:hypothetical protein
MFGISCPHDVRFGPGQVPTREGCRAERSPGPGVLDELSCIRHAGLMVERAESGGVQPHHFLGRRGRWGCHPTLPAWGTTEHSFVWSVLMMSQTVLAE